MPQIQPFSGLRYNLAQVGSLSEVIAPPYDVVDSKLQAQLYARSPVNFLRLELGQPQPEDQSPDDVYQRAMQAIKAWRADNILHTEPAPALYVYHQEFSIGGFDYVRKGFIARVRLERFGQGKIYPHEQTHAQAKEDRLKLTRATQTNLSPVFGLYPDPNGDIQELLEFEVAGTQGLVATDHLGVLHRMWPVTDIRLAGEIASAIENEPMFVADGHHRFEAACDYRDELNAKSPLPSNHPANYVMTMLVSMSDPGMVVLPAHRLLSGVPKFTVDELTERLGSCFEVHSAGRGTKSAESLWDKIESLEDQTTFGIYSKASNEWLLIRATESAQDRMKIIASDHSEAWQELGVAMLHRLIFADLLGLDDVPTPTYVHQVSEVVEGLEGRLEGSLDYSLAAMVMPATVGDIEKISLLGERMPAKSTYFYPKLASGMVANPLK